MVFNLLLASITILLCFFFFFLVIFNNFFVIPVVKENTRVKDAFANPTGTPITLIPYLLIPSLVADKTIEALSI